MQPVTFDYLNERLELADRRLAGRSALVDPQDLPGRHGRAVKAVDQGFLKNWLPKKGKSRAEWIGNGASSVAYDQDL